MPDNKYSPTADRVGRAFEEPNVGKASVEAGGNLPSPKDAWDEIELQKLRLTKARRIVAELLNAIDAEIEELSAKERTM
jgi:hypothetical protein